MAIMLFDRNPVIFLSRRVWKYAAGNRGWVILYVALFLCANGAWLLQPLIIAKIIEVIQTSGVTEANLSFILSLCSLFVIQVFVMWLFHGPARVIENKNAFLVGVNFKMYLINGTLDLPLAWHVDHHSGDTIDKIEKGTRELERYASHSFETIESTVRLVSSLVILAYFDIWAGIFVCIAALVILVLIRVFDRRLIEQYRTLSKFDNEISAKVFDVISNVTTVVILRIERLVSRSIFEKEVAPLKVFQQNSKLNEIKWFIVSVCTGVTLFGVLGFYFYDHVRLGIAVSLSVVYLLYSYAYGATDSFFRFTYLYGDLMRERSAVMNAEELSHEFSEKRKVTGVTRKWSELAINNLSFSYHQAEGADLHLDGVSMTIKRGEHVAFIGSSGSGKTTMLKILRGLYEVRADISLDGRVLKNGLESLSDQIALIPQDPEIFATTIRENITMGVHRSLEQIRKYTDMARFTDVVKRLPHELDSSIVEKGVNLSGGEKQRLALSRGLMASVNKTIILLDEPTSSVDLKNETAIYENIFRSFPGITVISSVHRLHLLRMFDTIYYFENGKIIAEGSLDNLLQSSEKFRLMWNKYLETLSREE